MRMWVQSLASLRGLRIQCCHRLRCRSQLCLWYRTAVAAPIRSLAWELSHAPSVALERKEKKDVAILTTKKTTESGENPVWGLGLLRTQSEKPVGSKKP